MATTTTNFGWDIPQSTDLVKDGATAIAALGQDIDTALVDLKGGTTGQVLAKATGTDLDYTWTTPQVGDITGVTAGTGISGGGTSGTVTVSINTAVTADLTTSQTLTNKTLTAPVISTPKISSTYSAKTASYTFASGDEGNLFSMNNAATQQFNIPTDATFNFAVGTEINVFWITGAGQPTIGAVTPGTTTVISTGATSATPKLRVANSGATCKKLAANSWIVFGDIA
jgi:trimeric autotransporter adhesin